MAEHFIYEYGKTILKTENVIQDRKIIDLHNIIDVNLLQDNLDEIYNIFNNLFSMQNAFEFYQVTSF